MFGTLGGDREVMSKKKFGIFLLSQTPNLLLMIVLALEAFGNGLRSSTMRHWISAALVFVIIGNLVHIVYLLHKRYGKRSQI